MKTSMFVVLASLFMACGTPKDGYVLKGDLKNAGNEPLIIYNIESSCGCTVASWAHR